MLQCIKPPCYLVTLTLSSIISISCILLSAVPVINYPFLFLIVKFVLISVVQQQHFLHKCRKFVFIILKIIFVFLKGQHSSLRRCELTKGL